MTTSSTAQFAAAPPPLNRLLRQREVSAVTGLSRQSIYAYMQDGTFPRPVKLSARLVAWREQDVRDWINAREPK